MLLYEINAQLKELEKDREAMRILANDLSKRYKEKGDQMLALIEQRDKINDEERKKERSKQQAKDSWDDISK